MFPNVTNWLLEDTDIKKSIVTHSKEKSNSINQGSLVCEEIGDVRDSPLNTEFRIIIIALSFRLNLEQAVMSIII